MGSARQVWEISRAILADQDGCVAVLKAYMDESGTHDGSPVLAVAAYVAPPSTWQRWTREWNQRKKPIDVFHAVDCAALKKEFDGWEAAQRDQYVAQLLPAITNANLMGVAAAIRMNDYDEVKKDYPEIEKFLGKPYAACFQFVVQEILEEIGELCFF